MKFDIWTMLKIMAFLIPWIICACIGIKKKSMEQEHEKNLDNFRKGQLK